LANRRFDDVRAVAAAANQCFVIDLCIALRSAYHNTSSQALLSVRNAPTRSANHSTKQPNVRNFILHLSILPLTWVSVKGERDLKFVTESTTSSNKNIYDRNARTSLL